MKVPFKYREIYLKNMHNRQSENTRVDIHQCLSVQQSFGESILYPNETSRFAVSWSVSPHIYAPFAGHRTKYKG